MSEKSSAKSPKRIAIEAEIRRLNEEKKSQPPVFSKSSSAAAEKKSVAEKKPAEKQEAAGIFPSPAAQKPRLSWGKRFASSPLWFKILLGVIAFIILLMSWKILVWIAVAWLLATIAIRLGGNIFIAGFLWLAFFGWLLVGVAFLWPSGYVADAIYHQSSVPAESAQSGQPAVRELSAPVDAEPAPEVLFSNFAVSAPDECNTYVALNKDGSTAAVFVTSDTDRSFNRAHVFVGINRKNVWEKMEEITDLGNVVALGDYHILISGINISAEVGTFQPWPDNQGKHRCFTAAQAQNSK